jgi:hypothetical protein
VETTQRTRDTISQLMGRNIVGEQQQKNASGLAAGDEVLAAAGSGQQRVKDGL